jgi:hypothetical protein
MLVVLNRKPGASERVPRKPAPRLAAPRRKPLSFDELGINKPLSFDELWSNALALISLAALVGMIVCLAAIR